MHGINIADMARQAAMKMAEQQVQIDLNLIEWAQRYCAHFLRRNIAEKFHKPLAMTLETAQPGDHINVICPRGYAKTTWITISIIRDIVEKRERYILLIMDTTEQATQSLGNVVQELETNEKLRMAYGAACHKGAIWNKNEIVTAAGVCVQALGTGKKVRGRKFREWRPTKIILDDPQNDENIASQQQRHDDWIWFSKALMKCGDDATKIIVVGTVLHKECIVCKVEKSPKFRTIRYRAILKWPKNLDLWDTWKQYYLNAPKRSIDGVDVRDTEVADEFYFTHQEKMNEGAVVLWPEKEDIYTLMREWAEDPISFASEKQNEAWDPTNTYFDFSWLSEERKEIWYDDVREFEKKAHITVGYIDWSQGKETKRGDYTALIIGHYDGHHCYIEADLQKIDVTRACANLIGWQRQVHFSAVGCESQGFQTLAVKELEAAMEEENETVPVVGIDTGNVPKKQRIARLSSPISRGYFKFKRNCPATELLIDQLLEFGSDRGHDDGPDALEGLMRLLHMLLSGGLEFTTGGHNYNGGSEPEQIIGNIS